MSSPLTSPVVGPVTDPGFDVEPTFRALVTELGNPLTPLEPSPHRDLLKRIGEYFAEPPAADDDVLWYAPS